MVFSAFRFMFSPSFSAQAEEGGNPMAQNKSMLSQFLASIATIGGDLSNITAPPFVLDPKSVVEIPAFWAENPTVFCSPATSEDPEQRALLVLRSFLSGMKSQCYMGHTEEEGVKKPLNSFLGEVFLGKWEDSNGTTYLVSEQVSHHPPITACRVWNEKHGVVAEGYNRQKITFNGSVNIHAQGHALKTIQKYDEHYLIPLPDFKVKGVLTGAPYPETSGTYYIPSTSGYMSVIKFSGGGLFNSSKKHSFDAAVYKEEEGEDKPLYTISGAWNSEFVVRDERKGEVIETYDVNKAAAAEMPQLILDPIDEQDPWESRRAWNGTTTAIRNGDMRGTSDAKGKLEQGQREMRKDEQRDGKTWEPLFFKPHTTHDIVEQLCKKIPGGDDFKKPTDDTADAIWKFDWDGYKSAKKPYRGDLRPDNTKASDSVASTPREQSRTSSPSQQPSQAQQQRLQNPTQKNTTGMESAVKPDGTRDEKVGAVEDGRPVEINGTKTDVGILPPKTEIKGITKRQPEPQTSQTFSRAAARGSGIEGMSVKEKDALEDMLRDQYSTRAPKG